MTILDDVTPSSPYHHIMEPLTEALGLLEDREKIQEQALSERGAAIQDLIRLLNKAMYGSLSIEERDEFQDIKGDFGTI